MDADLAALVVRVSRLERGCRRWRAASGLLAAGLGVVVLLGATRPADDPPKVFNGAVKARRFEVVNEAGEVKATLGMHRTKDYPLMFLANRGSLFMLSADAGDLSMTMSHSNDAVAYIKVDGKGPLIELDDREKKQVGRMPAE